MADDNPSNNAEEGEVEEDAAPVKKEKKPRKSKGKKHEHTDTDNAEEINVPNPDTDAPVPNVSTSGALEPLQNGVSSTSHDQAMRPKDDSDPATVPADGDALDADKNRRSASFSSADGSSTASGPRGGVEKLLRGIFVEPIVAVGAVAKDAGETAMKPVKQVPHPP
jgi:hypothetical protein